MLNQKSILLNNNFVILDEHPVVVDETVGGVLKDEETLKREKASKLVRTGVIKIAGKIDDNAVNTLSTSSFKGKLFQQEELVGKTVMYSANSIDHPIDVPIEGITRPILLNIGFAFAFLDDTEDYVE